MSKLTLSIEKQLIEKSKIFARETGRSLSELVSAYLESLVTEKKGGKSVSQKLDKLIGSVKAPQDFDEKKELEDYFRKKHL